jgi:uncharacterized protein (TIGR03663 family)
LKSTESRALKLLLVCAAAVALWVRLVHPEARPMHTDEAVNAAIVGDLLSGGSFHYDPRDRHGPSLFYVEAGLGRLTGARSLAQLETWQLRAAPALAGAATVAVASLLLTLSEGAVFAALCLALGAPFVFYGRYAIHETLLVLAFLGFLGAGWRWWLTGRGTWVIAAGFCAGLALATKESAPVLLAATAVASAVCWLHRPTRRQWLGCRAPSQRFAALGTAVATALLLAVAFYASFGANPQGVLDFLHSFHTLSGRALAGEGHEKPWWTYAAWLLRPTPIAWPWCGWFILAGAAWGIRCAFRPDRLAPHIRLLAVLSVVLAVLYSLVPYKTPWLVLDFLVPLALVAGHGIGDIVGRLRVLLGEAGAVGSALLLALLLTRETDLACFRHPIEPLNPFSYSPTSPDAARLAERVARIAASLPQGQDIVIEVAGADTWPLPWYLRKFPHVGYWTVLPKDVVGDIVIVSPDAAAEADSRLGPGWTREYYGLRADTLVLLYSKSPPERG